MKPPPRTRRAAMLAFVVLVAAVLVAVLRLFTKPVPVLTWTGQVLGSPYTVTIQDRVVNRGVRAVLDIGLPAFLSQMETRFSRETGRGLLADFNASPTTIRAYVGSELWRVVDLQKRLHQVSGAADVTLAPLEDLWARVAAGSIPPPGPDGLESVMRQTGMEFVAVPAEGYICKMRPQIKLSLDTVAQGYIADRLAIYLAENKVENYHLDIGGVVKSRNMPAFSSAVPVGLFGATNAAPPARVRLESGQMATVGRNDGMIHIDPRTGRPVSNGLFCVTVTAASCMEAKCLANLLYLLGADEGRAWVPANGEFPCEALFVVDKPGGGFETVTTARFPLAGP